MHEKYEDLGLSIVGVTSEGEAETKPWVAKHKAAYPYGYSRDLFNYFGVSAIPFAVLVDTEGIIVWKGHPSALSEKSVEIALRGALRLPLYEWPEEAAQAKQALLKRDYTLALKLAENLDPSFGNMIRARIKHLVNSMKRASKRSDYMLSTQLGMRVLGECKGLPEHEVARKLLQSFKDSPEITAVMRAQANLLGLVKKGERSQTRGELGQILQKIAALKAAHPEGTLARRATRALANLGARMERLKP